MDTSIIIVIVLGVIFVVGGPIIGNLASKASEKEETNKTKRK